MNSNGHKERPILFSGPMVRAILEGRKTQTRRVIIPQPSDSWMHNPNTDWSAYYKRGRFGLKKHLWIMHPTENKEIGCPYGAPGDRLWVRETWTQRESDCFYRATDQAVFAKAVERVVSLGLDLKWRPSIFMPRTLSRITLEITNVRVERLQEITAADAKAEGVDPFLNRDATAWRAGFQVGWDALNAKRGHSWENNPWVWVIEFKVL